MKLVTYEIRMHHIKGPEHDWWASGDQRVRSEKDASDLVTALLANERYRNVRCEDDPHEHHTFADIQTSLAGLSSWCTVEGCTWSWDYD